MTQQPDHRIAGIHIEKVGKLARETNDEVIVAMQLNQETIKGTGCYRSFL